jgi:hypothetical protein
MTRKDRFKGKIPALEIISQNFSRGSDISRV